ncbi:helix-turn-helix domain-containing protein [Streptomyces scopuliridis]|uniref:Helix-turn-helix domain-containing protein n=1 Tax=Streptomyces scopuliridis TaxID=452529 RepID=A0ACD4ZL68_9ACTN|nr:helix-turn-helix transcriptional regulator [Streptomyces scopuliridis]WSB98527.1 helix-turn-helix domain-containing protein [Streptomyces scopuliridis]WSC07771.1 helix-turn-helix domain-containing protein [Streptomyces scopuliridis]
MATTEAEAFAELLRGLKDRSGRSYGALAGKLHVSTSTLHRYCNGDAVPTDYASVERLARLCGANAEELVELHRRWILADEARRRARSAPPASAAPDAGIDAGGDAAPDAGGDGDGGAAAPAEIAPELEREVQPEPRPEPEPVVGSRIARLPRTKRLRLVLAAVAVVAVAVPAIAYGSGAITQTDDRSPATEVSEAPDQGAGESASPSASSDGKDKGKGKESPSASPTVSPSRSASPPASPRAGTKSTSPGGISDGAVPVSVNTRPYAFEDPCSQHYLIDSPPEEVPPPPTEQDAPGWVGALGGVASGGQFIELTLQGTSSDTVVLQALRVKIVKSGAPLAWTDYAMGVGCGGGVGTKSFAVNLDAARPSSVPKAGQRDFPYKVSESDPEVFYISATSKARDVSWYLELEWSSGERRGTIRVDDNGKPFRTSGSEGRPSYNYPPGGSEWGVAAKG